MLIDYESYVERRDAILGMVMDKNNVSKWTAISAVAVALVGLSGSVIDLYGESSVVESKGVAMEDEIISTVSDLREEIKDLEARLETLESAPLIVAKPVKKRKKPKRGYTRQWLQQSQGE